MKAVIMAGGEGTRLRPLTSHRPKPLVSALNMPIMEHIVLLLKRHGITDIVVTLHYLADEIQGYFGDGSDLGVNLSWFIEDTPLGTAGSVKQAEEQLKDSPFLIISGDALTDVNLERVIAWHTEKGSAATIVLAHNPNPLEYGVVITNDEGRVSRFLEKPSWGEVFSDTVNTGIYILEPGILGYMEPRRNYDWSRDIFPRLLDEGRPMFGYVMDGDYWCDVGNLQDYRESQYAVLDGATRIPLGHTPGQQDANRIWVADGCEIDPTAQIKPPVMIGRNCVIKANAEVGPSSVIGDQAIIESGAKIGRSILWDNVYVGVDSDLYGCTICSHATIKQGVKIQEGAVVGSGCRIEDGSTVRSQIKLWPDKIIEAGSTVTMSLVWGQKWAGTLFRKHGVTGIANVEITPDLACKLGASFGGYLRRGATVVASRDSGPVARMMKRALMSGLLSVGVNVLDMSSMPLPIARHTILGSLSGGGVHVRVAPNNPRNTLIEFFDGHGIYLSVNDERKVETIFFREDFRRVDAEQVGQLEFAGRGMEQYAEDFRHHVDADAVRNNALSVVADFAYGRLGMYYPAILGRLGCDVVALNAYPDVEKIPRATADRAAGLANLARIVQTLRADLGVLFEADGERLTLVDANGRIIERDALLTLMCVLFARTHPDARIAVPVTAPRSLEALTSLHGASITRTRTDTRDLMALCHSGVPAASRIDFAADSSGGFIFSEFQPTFDAMFSFSKLLEILATTGLRIAEIADELPASWLSEAVVKCPWEEKGNIMRNLMREVDAVTEGGGRVDLIDGLKFYHGDDWVLVMPDSSDPCFHVFAEAGDSEATERLKLEYVRKIEALRRPGL
ncbi:MAG: mannose-1-phosphate guanyltransferase [Armatimonadetes bacterium]|nr:mannose-1-phosphate guanyltransferase [Armatimonadota bacterium]MDE2205296.1 mannose-1-phosphate guanyltransferase [Armatimonadota bacterium]